MTDVQFSLMVVKETPAESAMFTPAIPGAGGILRTRGETSWPPTEAVSTHIVTGEVVYTARSSCSPAEER